MDAATSKRSWTDFLPPRRYGVYSCCIGLTIISLIGLLFSIWWLIPLIIFGALAALGTWDIVEPQHTVSRNYPIMAHFRYQMEAIGPEIRQYFIESDTEPRPFSREQRSLVYQRAKNVLDKKPFGTIHNLYEEHYEWLNPSIQPVHNESSDFRIEIGSDCKKPYSASVLNISAMSFGSLSGNAISALNTGARMGNFYHDTGEGAISPYHRQGGDLVWELGSAYFGCCKEVGEFDEQKFAEKATDDCVKMIEIKLSQGAKPGHGGILPGAKVSAEIAETRGVPVGKTVISPASHSTFSTPLEMMDFIEHLRELSGGKPVGFKLAVGHTWEWFALVKAMLESGKRPDFIVVDGGEGGTGAAPIEFTNRLGTPLVEGLQLVHNTLVGANLRQHISVGAAGKITSAFNIARTMALGADWCNAARGFMFSLGCIQARTCHTNRCPSGVATQDPRRNRHLDVGLKSVRVRNFHDNTLKALAEMLGAAGLSHPSELGPEHVLSRVSGNEVRSFDELYRFLEPGALLDGSEQHGIYRYWEEARADTFAPPESVLRLRESKLV